MCTVFVVLFTLAVGGTTAGGELVSIEKFPYLATLRIRDKNFVFHHRCEAVIIGHKHILTVLYI